MSTRSTLITICACGLFMGTASMAMASPPDLLAGPSIEDKEVTPQDMQSRRLQETGKKAKLNSRQQWRFWMSALESIELTKEQQTEVHSLIDEYRAKQKEFQKTYGTELSKIRKEQGNARQDGEMPTKESHNRMMEMMDLIPDPSSCQERAWALMTPDQQREFQIKYQAVVAEESKRREARRALDHSEMDGMMQRDTDRKPEEMIFTDRQRGDRFKGQDDADKDKMLRRIRFLRRLQDLKRD